MRGDAEINVDNESDAATADQEGKTSSGKSGKEKISVACRLPYLTIKENDELPKKYRKARQSKTQRLKDPLFVLFVVGTMLFSFLYFHERVNIIL